MYQALYRKWRPQTFDDVVGQQHITETLKRQIESGRLSHAYLFVGTRGTGKTTCAKILAKAVNCEHPVNGNPCNECASCRGIDSGAILDVVELDAASNNGVDNIRMLRDEAVYTPASVKKRVYIIDEVHMLSMAAFNALLKILEEPPEHLIFILATTELHKVPATIMSRCQRFAFKRLTAQQIKARLKYVAEREELDLTDDGADMLANLSEGALRDALSLLDQCIWSDKIDKKRVLSVVGLAGSEEISDLMESILSGDVADCIERLNRLYMDGKEMSAVLSELLSLYRDALIFTVAKDGGELLSGRFDRSVLEKIAAKAGARRLIRGVSTIEETLASMSRSTDVKTAAEMCLIMLADETLMPDAAGLEARIARLESGAVVYSGGGRSNASAEKPESADIADAPFDTEGAVIVEDKTVTVQKEAPAAKTDPAPSRAEEKSEAKPAGETAAEWSAILSAVEPKVSRSVFTFLSNEAHAVAKITGSSLSIGTKSAIAKNLIDTTQVKTAIKEASEKVLGRPVAVMVGDCKAESGEIEDKLDSLMRFGNIKFE